jgi:enoyl-CoA hydratase
LNVELEIIQKEIAILRVNRPEVRNALNWDTIRAFGEQIEKTQGMNNLRVLILTGGGGHFISGGDLHELHHYPTQADGRRLSEKMSKTLATLESLPIPTIAAMNGATRGGGAEISLACDFRVMAEDADFGLVQIKLGLTPGWGAGQRLLQLVGYSNAFDLLVTGRILTAQEALQLGLANRLAPKGGAVDTSITLARQIIQMPEDAVKAIKKLLQAGKQLPGSTAAAYEQSLFPPLWASETHLEAVRRFLEK